MATLKRPKKGRPDQPMLFGSPEPTVVKPAKAESKGDREKHSSELVGNNNRFPTNSDATKAIAVTDQPSQARPDDNEPPTDDDRQRSGSVSRLSAALGRYTPCYVLREQRSVIDLAGPDTGPDADLLVSTRRLLYIARNLFWAVASLPAWDLEPPLIWVRFPFEEQPSPPRECWLMTFELEELILGRLAAAEVAGQIDPVKMPDLRRRWVAIEREWTSGAISRAYDYCKIDSA